MQRAGREVLASLSVCCVVSNVQNERAEAQSLGGGREQAVVQLTIVIHRAGTMTSLISKRNQAIPMLLRSHVCSTPDKQIQMAKWTGFQMMVRFSHSRLAFPGAGRSLAHTTHAFSDYVRKVLDS